MSRWSRCCVPRPRTPPRLPEGFRKEPWSEAEKHAHSREVQDAGKRDHTAQVKRLEEAVTTPVEEPPPKAAAKAPAPPPRRRPVRQRPRR